MSRIGISLCRLMIPVGIMILLVPNIVAKKQPAVVESGRDIFMDRCAACHGDDAKGNGPAVGALKTAPVDLTLLAQKNGGVFPAERLKRIVGGWENIGAHGSREMPIWGDLFGAKSGADLQIANDRFKILLAYLDSIQQ